MLTVKPIATAAPSAASQNPAAEDNAARLKAQRTQRAEDPQAIQESVEAESVRERAEQYDSFRTTFREKNKIVTEVLDPNSGKVIYEIPPGLKTLEPDSLVLSVDEIRAEGPAPKPRTE